MPPGLRKARRISALSIREPNPPMNLIRHGREETGTQCLRRWLETTRIAFPPGRLILHHLHMSDASLLSVRAIDHVAVIARDLEASRHFYEEILGMRSVPRPDFPFPGSGSRLAKPRSMSSSRAMRRGPPDPPASPERCPPVVITWPLNSTTARSRSTSFRPPVSPSRRAPSPGLTDSGRSTSTTPTATWSNCFPRHRGNSQTCNIQDFTGDCLPTDPGELFRK